MERDQNPKNEDHQKKDQNEYHIPVLINEVIENLNIKPDGIYVDCTFGGGGHSRAILNMLSNEGKLVAFDHDEDAGRNVPNDNRILFVPQSFKHLHRFLKLNGIDKVDGVLADLGVSSHQLDIPERGFSTRYDAELDMRMDRRQFKTAAEIVNQYSEGALHLLFEQYGEVTNAKTLAKTITEVRKSIPIKTIHDFKSSLNSIVKGNPNKYFAKVFQALRIEVNDEMGALKELLMQLPTVLKNEGRACIITFHSIEDRLVKIFFKENTFDIENYNPFETTVRKKVLIPVTKKPVVPSPAEIKLNPRSRSAKLRIAIKKIE